jgi:hypothetical protein
MISGWVLLLQDGIVAIGLEARAHSFSRVTRCEWSYLYVQQFVLRFIANGNTVTTLTQR